MSEITKILHVSLLVADIQRSLEFYQGVLGLGISDARPDLGFPGAWLEVGDQQIHLLELDNPDSVDGRPEHGGRDRHTAMAITNIGALRERLDDKGIPYSMSKSGRLALFCRDPDGNALELIQS